MRKKSWIAWSLFMVMIAVTAGLLVLLTSKESKPSRLNQPLAQLAQVKIITFTLSDHLNTMAWQTQGRWQPEQSVSLQSPRQSVIQSLAVSEGEVVSKGQKLMQLKSESADWAVDQALLKVKEIDAQIALQENSIQQANLALEQVNQQVKWLSEKVKTYQRLLNRGSLSKDQFDAIAQELEQQTLIQAQKKAQVIGQEKNLKLLQIKVKAANISLKQTRWEQDKLTIRSPMGGRVQSLFFSEGDELNPGQTLVTLLGHDWIIKALVAYDQLDKVTAYKATGMKAYWKQNQVMHPLVIDAMVTSETLSQLGKDVVLKPSQNLDQKHLYPGRRAWVSFVQPIPKGSFVVPPESLVLSQAVYRVTPESKVMRVPVTLIGFDQAKGWPVIQANDQSLKHGDRIVRDRPGRLVAGQTVTVDYE